MPSLFLALSRAEINVAPITTAMIETAPIAHILPVFHSPRTAAAINALVTI